MTGQSLIVQGDALHLPLPDASVDLVITSPPFHNLRDYGVAGQIGNEPTRDEFLDQLWAVTRECMRVMKPTASLFVELGDSYANRATPARAGSSDGLTGRGDRPGRLPRGSTPEKSLNLAPQRYVIGCVDDLGLILRAEIIWDRPNGLPESVKDRVRLSHSRWWHLTKQPRYYSATDEIRERYSQATDAIHHRRNGIAQTTEHPSGEHNSSLRGRDGRRDPYENPLGKLPGSVWSVPSEPLRLPDHLGVQHYAAFPSEWPRRLILGFSPPGICLDCGQGRVPVTQPTGEEGRHPGGGGTYRAQRAAGEKDTNLAEAALKPRTILGYACGCTPHTLHPGSEGTRVKGTHPSNLQANPGGGVANYERHGPWREYHLDRWQAPPTRPAVVCDPFAGTFTTVMVARALGRIGIGVDLSMPYCKAGRWRVRHDGAKAVSRTWAERQGSLL